MADNSFSAAVSAWVKKAKWRQDAVFKESAQRVGQAAIDGAPFKTGFLRGSAVATLGEANIPVTYNTGGTFSGGNEQISAVIANATINDTITILFTASYAMRIEYGFTGTDSLGREYHQAGSAFVRRAVQTWPQIVNAVCNELKDRSA